MNDLPKSLSFPLCNEAINIRAAYRITKVGASDSGHSASHTVDTPSVVRPQ